MSLRVMLATILSILTLVSIIFGKRSLVRLWPRQMVVDPTSRQLNSAMRATMHGRTESNFALDRDGIIPNEYVEVEEEAAKAMLQTMQLFDVSVPSYISSIPVPTACVKYKHDAIETDSGNLPPIVFLHGFDSSALELRRLAPLVGNYTDVYVPDILGWGFSDISSVSTFTPKAKLDHMKCFLEQVVQKPCVLCGASLGGAIAIILAASVCPDLIKKVVLIDAQGFIDGDGPSKLPEIFARLAGRETNLTRLSKAFESVHTVIGLL